MPVDSRILTGALICTLMPSFGALADDRIRFDVTPMVGYRAGGEFDELDPESTTDDSVDLDDGATFGIGLGFYRDSRSFYEILYSRQESGIDSSDPAVGSVDVATEYLHFGGTLLFPDARHWFVPWLSLGIGVTRLDPEGGFDSETEWSGSIGGGVRMPFNEQMSATLGARGYATLLDSDTAIFCVSSGGLDCLVQTSGSLLFQGEVFAGLSFRF
jgi:hypothetical protein